MNNKKLAQEAWLEGQKNKGKDTVVTRFMENRLNQKISNSEPDKDL